MYYVYVITKEELPYIGYTSDLKRRIREHSLQCTVKLIYYEAYLEEQVARTRELQLKKYGSSWQSIRKRINIK